ncbi:MAG: hypothetical protein WDM79_15315 [Terricaulis sp.]
MEKLLRHFGFAISVTLLSSSVAFADVGASALAYLRSWHVGASTAEVIRSLGSPDFVILPTDNDDIGQELREDHLGRELVWRVRGCAPVRAQVDLNGRTVGLDYSSLVTPQTFCSATMVAALTPSPRYSCAHADRQPHCR